MKHSITAIVPNYNESEYIETSIKKLLEVDEVEEIIIVDDSSTDNSLDIIKDLVKKNSKVRFIELSKNSGKGNAIKSAFSLVKTTYTVIHDSDLEYDPSDIKLLISKINLSKKNLILGSRFKNNSSERIYLRTFYANKIISLVFSIVYGIRITDVATCYKLMPSKFLQTTTFNENGFAIEIEMLAKFLKFNREVSEVEINYKPRSYQQGKKIKFLDGIRYLFAIIRYRFTW